MDNTAQTTSSDSVRISDLGLEELGSISAVHRATFPDDPISKLGMEATRRYYERLIVGPYDTVALGAYLGSELVGVCIGGRFNGPPPGYWSKNRWYLAWRIATHPWLLLHHRFRERIVQSAKRFRRSEPQPQVAAPQVDPPRGSSFEYLLIAVSPDCQGRGVGTLLMEEAQRRAERTGYESMHLTPHPRNVRAVQLYERFGFQKVPNDENWRGGMYKRLEPAGSDESGLGHSVHEAGPDEPEGKPASRSGRPGGRAE